MTPVISYCRDCSHSCRDVISDQYINVGISVDNQNQKILAALSELAGNVFVYDDV